MEGFCDLFLNRLESPNENWLLKLACVNFFTVCVGKQAGLAEHLTCSITLGTKFDANFVDNGGGLKLIYELMRSNNVQPELFVACLRFFTTLWRCKWTESIKILKEVTNFWPTVAAPLTASEEEFFLKMCTEILDLLTLDLYYFSGKYSATTTDGETSSSSSKSWKIVEKLLNSDRMELIFVKFKEFFESNCELEEKLTAFNCWCNFIDVVLALGESLFDENIVFDLIRHGAELQLTLVS